MINAFLTEESIYDLLVGAQSAGGDFDNSISSTLNIENYSPGDFMHDGILDANDGLYIYFDDTNFTTSNAGESDSTHDPIINLDFYVSSSAEKVGPAAVTFSPQKAYARIKTVVGQVYDVIENAQFRRLLDTAVKLKTGYRAFRISPSRVTRVKRLATLRLTDSSKTIMIFRIMIEPQVVEKHLENAGSALTGVDDRLVAVADTDDLPDPFPAVV